MSESTSEIVLDTPRFLTPEEARRFNPSGDVVTVTVQTRAELLAEFKLQRIKPSKAVPFAFGRCVLDFYSRGCWCSALTTQIDDLDSLDALQQSPISSATLSDTLLRSQVCKLVTMIYGPRAIVWVRCNWSVTPK